MSVTLGILGLVALSLIGFLIMARITSPRSGIKPPEPPPADSIPQLTSQGRVFAFGYFNAEILRLEILGFSIEGGSSEWARAVDLRDGQHYFIELDGDRFLLQPVGVRLNTLCDIRPTLAIRRQWLADVVRDMHMRGGLIVRRGELRIEDAKEAA